MPLNNSISNIIGTKIPYWLWQQFQTRSKKGASDFRDNEVLKYITNKTAWVRMVSSIDIKDSDLTYFQKMNPEISKGDDLAKQYTLFGGTSKYLGSNSYELRSGFSGMDSNLPYGKAYGIIGNPSSDVNEVANYGYRPMPGIVNVNVETQGRLGSVRAATINFKCWDKDQLDIIDALYFKLGFTMFLEWGHTYYFPSQNPTGNLQTYDPNKAESTELLSIDPFDEKYRKNKEEVFKTIAQNYAKSEGNYDAMLGIVTNFNFSYNQEGGFDCMVKIISLGVLGDSIKVNHSSKLVDILQEQIKSYEDTLKIISEPTGSGAIAPPEPNILEKNLSNKNNPKSYPGESSKDPVNLEIDAGEDFGKFLYIKRINQFLPIISDASTYPTQIQLDYANIKKSLLSTFPEYWNLGVSNDSYKTSFIGPKSRIQGAAAQEFLDYSSSKVIFIQDYKKANSSFKIEVSRDYAVNDKPSEEVINQLDAYLETNRLITIDRFTEKINKGKSNSWWDFLNVFDFDNKKSQISIIPNGSSPITLTGTNQFETTSPRWSYGPESSKIIGESLLKSLETAQFQLSSVIPTDLPNGIKKYAISISTQIKVSLPGKAKIINLINDAGKLIDKEIDLKLDYPINITLTFEETDLIKFIVSENQFIQELIGTVSQQETSATQNANQEQTQSPLSHLSSLELSLRSIQVHSLVTAIKKQKSIDINKQVTAVPLWEIQNGVKKTFAEQVFTNGIFTPYIKDLINGTNIPDDYNDSLGGFKVYAKYGFVTKLLSNQAPVNEFTKVNYRELLTAYVLPYDKNSQIETGTTLNHPVYIPLGQFLLLLNHSCTIYDSEGQVQRPLVYIDFNPNHSFCLTTPEQLSTDPFRVMIPYEGLNADYRKLFDKDILEGNKIKAVSGSSPTDLFSSREETPKDSPNRDNISGALLGFSRPEDSPYRARIMNILLNIDYLIDVIKQFAKRDEENKVFLKPLIEQILTDTNKCIGNFNIFRLAYNDIGNVFQIVDDQVIPVSGDKEQQVLSNNSGDPTDLPLFGKSSVAKSLEIKTEVSTRLSNMLAISANSVPNQGSNSTDSTPFGFINYNYVDRYIPERTEVTGSGVNLEGEKSAATDFNTAVKAFYGDTRIDEQKVATATNYYIDKLTKVKASGSATRAAAMIPVSLNFTTDGISGLSMGQAFTVDNNYLPYTYSIKKMFNDRPSQNKVGFVITGLSHTIEANTWNTAVKTNMIFLKDKIDYSISRVPSDKKEEPTPAPAKGGSNFPRGTNLTENISANPVSNFLFGKKVSYIGEKVLSQTGHGSRGRKDFKNWQSSNAWDLFVEPFTPVYAIFDGVVKDIAFRENPDLKTVWGWRFTLEGSNGVSAFYTHLDRVTLIKGEPGEMQGKVNKQYSVKKGELLGFVGKPPDPYAWPSHLHIGISSGGIKDYLSPGTQFA